MGAEYEGAGTDDDAIKALVYPDIYDGYLGAILALCDTDAESLECRAKLIFRFVLRRIKQRLKDHDPTLLKLLTACPSGQLLIQEFSDSEFFDQSNVHGGTFNRRQLRAVARRGLWLALTTRMRPGHPFSRLAWGLALIGYVDMNVRRAVNCRICFRKAWPGNIFCDEHSQSNTDNSNRGSQFVKYRLGKKARALAEQRGVADSFLPNPHFEPLDREGILLGMLFPRIVDSDDLEFLQIHRYLLSQSPYVLNRLGGCKVLSFSVEKLLDCLREKLDPHDYFSSAWADTIRRAEAWFRLEEEAGPKKRGKGRSTMAMVDQAIIMARNGYSKSEIAAQLNVGRPVISNWVRRYPAFSEAIAFSRRFN